MANVGTLAVSLVAKTNQYENAMKKAGGTLKRFVAGFVSVAAIGMAMRSLASSVQSAANEVDSLAKQGRALGMTYQEMRSLSIMAKLTGLEITSLNTAFRTMSNQLDAANQGNKTSIALLDRLGVSAAQFKGQQLPQIMETLAKAMANIKDPAERVAVASQIFGRSGPQIAEAALSMGDAAREARLVADTLTDDMAKSIENANDQVTLLGENFKTTMNEMAASISGPATKLLKFTSMVTRMSRDLNMDGKSAMGASMQAAFPLFSLIRGARNLPGELQTAALKEADRQIGMSGMLGKAMSSVSKEFTGSAAATSEPAKLMWQDFVKIARENLGPAMRGIDAPMSAATTANNATQRAGIFAPGSDVSIPALALSGVQDVGRDQLAEDKQQTNLQKTMVNLMRSQRVAVTGA